MKRGIEVTGKRGRRCRKLLDDLKGRRGYAHLKKKTLERTMWRTHFGRSFGPVVRQTAKGMNVDCILKCKKVAQILVFVLQYSTGRRITG
jgi:hypothetical protein